MDDPRDAPMRLRDAVRIAFPDGTMKVSGLRRERDRNRLVVERIAGKEYTTLNHIQTMRELCRVHPKDHDSNSVRPRVAGKPTGRSSTRSPADMKKALDAARLTVRELSKSSPST